MATVGMNPARILPAWQAFAADHVSTGRSFRGVGEPIWAQRSADELAECQRHESLLNVAFDGNGSWRLICPYDVDALAPAVVDEALRSHPFVVDDGVCTPSGDYRGLAASGAPFDLPLPDPPTIAEAFDFDETSLAGVRGLVHGRADRLGFDATASGDLALAAHEIAANSVCYGGGSGTLRTWANGDVLICEITDRGHLDEPLVGRELPPVNQTGGRGLWLAHHLCNLVQIRNLPTGTVVRLHQYRR
jgi:anti-sigma regulatory factor (Ser/Thr protein kinase)